MNPQLWGSHTGSCPPSKHKDLPFPGAAASAPCCGSPSKSWPLATSLFTGPAPFIRRGSHVCSPFPAPPPCQPSLGLTQLWCSASPQVFQPGTSVSASVGPHPKKTGLPANRLSLTLWPRLQPHSPETLSPFQSLARKLTATQEVQHSSVSLPAIFLHTHSTGDLSTHTPGVYCSSS